MTNKELTETYLKTKGLVLTKGDGNEALLPFLIMDVQYQIYGRTIRGLDCKHQSKAYKKKWIDAYNAFNKEFFSAFNREQQDIIIEKMDAFEEYIHNDVTIAELKVMDLLAGEPLETQKVIAHAMMCNILAQIAQIVYKRVFRHGMLGNKPTTNINIKQVETNTYLFMNEFHKKRYDINSNENKPLQDSVRVLCKKIVKWINEV